MKKFTFSVCSIVSLFMVNMVLAEPLSTPDRDLIEYPDDEEPSAELVQLGKVLFFENRISAEKNQSCASCHNPDLGFSDGSKTSMGSTGPFGGRNAPQVNNLAWNVSFFWDGRAASLEEQALGPVVNPLEMAITLDQLVSILSGIAGYKPLFNDAFGDDEISAERFALAVAAYQRTLIVDDTAFDRYLAGESNALSQEAKRGLAVFEGKGNCIDCHDGANLSDNGFHNIGLKSGDDGRSAIAGDTTLKGAFKTPGLRNIVYSAPYFHNGSAQTLLDVVKFYNRGGDGHANTSNLIKPLKLTPREELDLVAFMGALTGTVDTAVPQLPE